MTRIAALDNAKAVLLLSGIVYHSFVFVYLYQPPSGTAEFLFVVYVYQFLHVFRMPAFFVIAGFFAAYLLDTRGRNRFLKNRTWRILLPLVIFWPPLGVANIGASQGSWIKGTEYFRFFPVDFQHLWFLHFLFLFSLVLFLAWPFFKKALVRRIRPGWYMGILVIVLPLIPGVLDREGTLATSTKLIPEPGLLTIYFLIYLSGAVAYFQQELWLGQLKKGSFWLIAALLATFSYFFLVQDLELAGTDWVYSSAMVLGAYGVIGLFLRVGNNQNRVMKFVSGASYWIYLIHLPVVFVCLVALSRSGLSALPVVFLTSLFTAVFGVVSYKLLVRHTPLSRLLNGKRYPLRARG